MIISGVVDPTGKPFSGSGFKVDKTDRGLYTVLFIEEFNIVPAVTATEIYPWPLDSGAHGGSTKDNCTIPYVSSDRVRIKTGDSEGNAQDRAFTFIASGT
jgi:hypothetical protein